MTRSLLLLHYYYKTIIITHYYYITTFSLPFRFSFDHLLKHNSASDYLNILINTLTLSYSTVIHSYVYLKIYCTDFSLL